MIYLTYSGSATDSMFRRIMAVIKAKGGETT